jgi:hypothetical protein
LPLSVCQSYPEKLKALGPTVPDGVPAEEPDPDELEPEEPLPEDPLPDVPLPEEPEPLPDDPLPDDPPLEVPPDPLLEVPLPDPVLVPLPLPVPVDPVPEPVPLVDPLCEGVRGMLPPPHPTRNMAANNKTPILGMKIPLPNGDRDG